MPRATDILRRLVLVLVTAACVVLAVAMLGPALAGYERYVIVSGSMTGTHDQGSVVYAKQVAVDKLRVGDVITYAPPAGAAPTELVTHRIASIRAGRDGRRVFRTRGDANPAADPWRFTLDSPVQSRVEFSVPYVGYAVSALSDRKVRMGVIGIPALLIALGAVLSLACDIRRQGRAPARVPAPAAGDWTRL